MHTFEFYIEDDRYTVASFELVSAADVPRARQLAADRLYASRHHLGIEVRLEGQRVCRLARSGPAAWAGDAPLGPD